MCESVLLVALVPSHVGRRRIAAHVTVCTQLPGGKPHLVRVRVRARVKTRVRVRVGVRVRVRVRVRGALPPGLWTSVEASDREWPYVDCVAEAGCMASA